MTMTPTNSTTNTTDTAVNHGRTVTNPEPWPAPQPQTTTTPAVKHGPLQIASFLIGGGGLAVLLSAALPWVSALGGVSGRPGGGEVVALLILGGSLTFLASLVYRTRSLSTARVMLWVLAVVDIVVVLAFFGALKLDSGVVGDVVSPGIGFYLALLGLISSIVGTVTQQIAKPKTIA